MTDNYDKPTKKFGECLRYQDLEAAWTPAKYACPSEQAGAFLYQEFTQQKHNFVQRGTDLMKKRKIVQAW